MGATSSGCGIKLAHQPLLLVTPRAAVRCCRRHVCFNRAILRVAGRASPNCHCICPRTSVKCDQCVALGPAYCRHDVMTAARLNARLSRPWLGQFMLQCVEPHVFQCKQSGMQCQPPRWVWHQIRRHAAKRGSTGARHRAPPAVSSFCPWPRSGWRLLSSAASCTPCVCGWSTGGGCTGRRGRQWTGAAPPHGSDSRCEQRQQALLRPCHRSHPPLT
jgi:hypothetical protein